MNIKSKLQGWTENVLIVFTGFIFVFMLAGDRLAVPVLLQVLGRSHPLLLHFPIVLMLIAVVFMLIPDILPVMYQRKITQWALLLALVFAGITVLSGWVLSQEEGYEGDRLALHKWMGVAVYFVGLIVYFTMDRWPKIVRPMGSVLVVVLISAGHLGADLTHGSGFLMEPMKSNDNGQVALEEAEVYHDLVRPILEQKCINCHQASKSKGELRLDEVALILRGGKSGTLFDSSNWEKSLLVQRITLPLEEKKHMPPKGKAQLTAGELELLKLWVKGGADFEEKVKEKAENDPLYQLASLQLKKEASYDFPAADHKEIQSLNNFYRVVTPLYPGAAALEVSYFGAAAFEAQSLKELKKVSAQVVRINLSRMPLEKVDMNWLKDFKELEELKLNFTGISTEQLEVLASLPKLKRLSLAGNPLGPEVFGLFSSLPALESVSLWNTGLEEAHVHAYAKELSKVLIEWGFEGGGLVYRLNPPEIKLSREIFEGEEQLTISHPISAVKFRYTLDGSEPDSASSAIYEGPITVNTTGQLKAIALAEGWQSSEPVAATFYSIGRKPTAIHLKTKPADQYKGKGEETLFDQKKGGDNYATEGWLGFKEEPMELEMELDSHPVKMLAVSLMYHEEAYIFPPAKVEISAVIEGEPTWKTVVKSSPEMPTSNERSRMAQLVFDLPEGIYQKIRLKLVPVQQLPAWHRGAGEKGWVFVDEVVLN